MGVFQQPILRLIEISVTDGQYIIQFNDNK